MADSTITAALTDAGARAWERTVSHKTQSTFMDATDIGWLKKDNSRANVLSRMGENDRTLFFAVNAVTPGPLRVAHSEDADIRIQIMDNFGRTIADSKADMGQASENYALMEKGEYEATTGKYIVKVTRGEGVPPKQGINLAIQLEIGTTYTDDYVTQDVPTDTGKIAAQQALQSAVPNMASSILAQGLSDTGPGSAGRLFSLIV